MFLLGIVFKLVLHPLLPKPYIAFPTSLMLGIHAPTNNMIFPLSSLINEQVLLILCHPQSFKTQSLTTWNQEAVGFYAI